MHSYRFTMALVLAILALPACKNQTDSQDNKEEIQPALSIQQVADGVYVHTGQHVPLDSPESDDIANIGFIVGDDCVAVLDTGGSVDIGRQLRQTIKATTDVPVCYVIDTHVHYDHLLGNLAFQQPDIKFMGHEQLPGALATSKAFFQEQFPQYLGEKPAEAIIAPDQTVSESRTIDLGNRVLELRAWPSGHTSSDLTVYDRQTQTLWAADLLFMERIPALDASLKGWLDIMDKLKQIPAERVVPGHGPASAPWPEAMKDQRRYLTTLLEETRAAIQAGKFLDAAMDTVAQEEAAKWQLADQHHRRNISRAYRELEWE